MRVLVVDDEPLARAVLREQLEETPDVTVAGEASCGAQAISEIERLKPDAVFLDLQMPGLDGLSVARNLTRRPLVVFVTAHREYAAGAFEVNAVDYLLKPVRRERLEAALTKLRTRLGPASDSPRAARKIVGKAGADLVLLDPSEVIAFKAEGDLVHIVTANRRFLAMHSLRKLAEKLPARGFRRIHRATIINTDHIRRISPLSSKRWLLKMSNGMEAIVSKRLAGSLREETGW